MSLKAKILNAIKVSVSVAALWVLTFGLFQTGMVNPTQPCPLSGHEMSICQMNPLEHIKEWQSTFAMTPVQAFSMALLAFAALSFSILNIRLWKKTLLSLSFILLVRKRRLRNQILKIQDQVQEAFSSGILNPKTF